MVEQTDLDACTAAQISHFLEGDSSASNDIFTAYHVAQCFACLNEAIDANRMVGHLVVDISVEGSWR